MSTLTSIIAVNTFSVLQLLEKNREGFLCEDLFSKDPAIVGQHIEFVFSLLTVI